MASPVSPISKELSERLRDQLRRLLLYFEDMRAIAPPAPGVWTPIVDLCEMEDVVVVRVELPGVKAANVKVTMLDGVLKIEGRKERIVPDAVNAVCGDKPLRYLCLERASGHFMRRVTLKWMIDLSQVSARLADGILQVRLPKAKEAGREINIQVTEE
ncbi:MAG TPA: Hsp20/alpha crystallin family protein [Blastocatellia bacterium]|nr:Hsp20/alpha crystallin family protein [Blastocatellia bacterium]